MSDTTTTRLIRKPEVMALTARSSASIYRGIRQNTFPKPVKLGEHTVAWIASEVHQWVADRIAERDGESA